MADVFEGGNSPLAGCQGTYRNGSEVTTGLIFAGTPQQNGSPCDPIAEQGWIGSIDGASAYGTGNGDWLQLDFKFAPDSFLNGAKFEFDCDTDGGIGVNGGAMEGVVVTVQLKNGSILRGEIAGRCKRPVSGVHMSMKLLRLSLLPTSVILGTLPAQRDLAAGFGSQSLSIDLDAATGSFLNLGIQHLDGEIFVSSRGSLDVKAPHFVTVFDGSGTNSAPGLNPPSPRPPSGAFATAPRTDRTCSSASSSASRSST